jgi:cytochrome b561
MKFLDGYDNVAKAIHWLMALMIISLLAVGIYMHDLPKEDSLRPTLYMLHKASGMTVLFLFFIRVVWRLLHKPPSLDRYSGLVKKAATVSHISLYILMFAVPAAGYLMSAYYGYAVDYFGLFKLPLLVGKDKEMADLAGEAHEILAFIMIGVLVLHIAGAIKHRFFENKTNP